MHLSELQEKEIVSLNDGKKLGKIIDVEIIDNKIINLLIEPKRYFLKKKKKSDDILLHWSSIEKIGEDVILINNKKNNI